MTRTESTRHDIEPFTSHTVRLLDAKHPVENYSPDRHEAFKIFVVLFITKLLFASYAENLTEI